MRCILAYTGSSVRALHPAVFGSLARLLIWLLCLSGATSAVARHAHGQPGIHGTYFADADLSTPVLTRVDPNVNFNWGLSAPADGVPADGFSVRWEGFLEAPLTGPVTFQTTASDGIRLWVDGALAIDAWYDGGKNTAEQTLTMTAGERVPVTVEYYEATDHAAAYLWWSYDGQLSAPIAPTFFFLEDDAPPPPSQQIELPIEVIGPDGYTTEVSFSVDDPAGITDLYLDVHRPGYRNGEGGKASFQLNGGAWIDLSNETAEVYAPASKYGGIGGAFFTMPMAVPVTGVVAGENTLAFRFNGTDGYTIGYRVLGFNLLVGGAQGTPVLPAEAFTQTDPAAWAPPRDTPADIAEGERLWDEGGLVVSSLDDTPIRATCSQCHASSGHDLQYFAFSNQSIVERSTFHGLTEEEGEQIASYIRALALEDEHGLAYAPPGRPWNPPYQPGPGLDAQPVERWAAGAGLDAVLGSDAEMLPFLFPNGTTSEAVRAVADTENTLNMRELPIALQLPDWNAWLPEVHPIDIWGDTFLADPSFTKYEKTHTQLTTVGRDGLLAEHGLEPLVRDYIKEVKEFIADREGAGALLPPGFTEDDVIRNYRHWMITKVWEISQVYYLEETPTQVYTHGERGWIGRRRTVFEVAPHLAAEEVHFAHQSEEVGRYMSTAWYQLQIILNPGYRDSFKHFPVDWKYHNKHIENLYAKIEDNPREPFRFVASLIKSMQMFDNDYGASDAYQGWNLRQVEIDLLADPDRKWSAIWAELDDTMLRNIREGVFGAWLEETLEHDPADYPRWTLGGDDYDLYGWAPADIAVPVPAEYETQALHLLKAWDMVTWFADAGVADSLVTDLADWGASMWPNGDWHGQIPASEGQGEGGQQGNGDPTGSGLPPAHLTPVAAHGLPAHFALASNYPNPFNPQTTIGYALPEATPVRLRVFDALGRVVATLVDGTRGAGHHTATFEASHLPSGLYLYRLEAGHFTQTRTMLLVK